jgi:hypothetical protein
MEFIFTTILMVCLGTVLYLMVVALPRIEEVPGGEKKGFFDRWAHSEIPEKVDAAFNGFLLKFLRKVKVFIMKLDNSLGKHVQKINPENRKKVSNIDFKEISGQNKEDLDSSSKESE